LQRWFVTLAHNGEGQTKSEKTGRERGPVKRKKKHRIVFRASKANQKKIETGLLALRCFRKETYGKEWRLHC
jgi:hypothetical protein